MAKQFSDKGRAWEGGERLGVENKMMTYNSSMVAQHLGQSTGQRTQCSRRSVR